jgi:hypothetical protein
MSDDITAYPSNQVSEADIDEAAKKGWAWFTRFLLINLILCVLALLLLGALTVWS